MENFPLENSAFDLVYQGGHHDVFCNGERHIKISGGFAGKWKPDIMRGPVWRR